MGEPPVPETDLHYHLLQAADKADLALRALDHGDHNGAAAFTVGIMASLDDAARHPAAQEGTPLYTAHWHIGRLAESATDALNCLDAAAKSRADVRAEREGQAALLADDARLHLRAARTALAAHTRATGGEGGPR